MQGAVANEPARIATNAGGKNMSVINESKEKIVLPRSEPDPFWSTLAHHYAGDNQRRWKWLAMLALHECAEWPLDCIAEVFAHRRRHVAHMIEKVKNELRGKFADGRKKRAPDNNDDTNESAPQAA